MTNTLTAHYLKESPFTAALADKFGMTMTADNAHAIATQHGTTLSELTRYEGLTATRTGDVKTVELAMALGY